MFETLDDAKQFHAAIEQAVVPAARRLNAQRRLAHDAATLRDAVDVIEAQIAALEPIAQR